MMVFACRLFQSSKAMALNPQGRLHRCQGTPVRSLDKGGEYVLKKFAVVRVAGKLLVNSEQ